MRGGEDDISSITEQPLEQPNKDVASEQAVRDRELVEPVGMSLLLCSVLPMPFTYLFNFAY